MTVFVDEIQHYPQTRLPYKYWCHMACDGDLEELHRMAGRIGLKLAWFQQHPTLPHYDLVPSKRALAIRYGAIAIPAAELARRNFEAHKPHLGEPIPVPAEARAPASVTVEYRAGRRRRCQCTYGKKNPCQNLTNWFLMPRGLAICKTCALFLAQNNQAETNRAVLAPMLGTSNIESWIQATSDKGK